MGMAAVAGVAGWKGVVSPWNALAALPAHQGLRPLNVTLPPHAEPLPYHSNLPGSRPAFPLRGMKGWAWSPEQYLAEIPVMAKYRLNFLMNCYSSLWNLGPHGRWGNNQNMNFWYKPLSPSMRAKFADVIRSCQKHDVNFCFSVNPNLRSDKPFNYTSAEDFDALWQHYEWSQGLGVTWFNVSLDDISRKIDAAGQAQLINKVLKKLRKRDPKAQLTFCPTWYSGTGTTGVESHATLGAGDTPGVRYTKELAKDLHPDVYLFWTGPKVRSFSITAKEADEYKALSRHRILIWDNYPVNDQQPALNLGPLTGRSKDLHKAADGYMANAMAYQNIANRIPLLTIADYSWNPYDYDPMRSIAQSVTHLGATPDERVTLQKFVELYPGGLWDKQHSARWNSLLARFDEFRTEDAQAKMKNLVAKSKSVLHGLNATYSNPWASGAEVLKQNIKTMTS